LSGKTVDREIEPTLEHHLEERTQLQRILCDFNMNLSPRDITDRKVRAVNLMVVLACRRELRRPTPNQVYGDAQGAPDALGEVKSGCSIVKEVEEIPLVLEKTQCIYCIGNEQLSYQQRTFRFSRVSHMQAGESIYRCR
ncbi:hypothetical protein EDB81DRAFT_668718, partial [Dactylonectria macrodidyma]